MSKRYGLPYKGSKNKIANDILRYLPSGKRFVDLCGGGGAMTHAALLSGKYEEVLYSDIDGDILRLFMDAVNGLYSLKNFDPQWISREDFEAYINGQKELPADAPPSFITYVKLCWSFGNNCKDYLYGGKIEPWKKLLHEFYIHDDISLFDEYGITIKPDPHATRAEKRKWLRDNKEQLENDFLSTNKQLINSQNLQNLERLQRLEELQSLERLQRLEELQSLERLEGLERLEISNYSYKDYKHKDGDVVYIDPPYENVTGYNDIDFNHEEFYSWVKAQPYQIFFSSYEINNDDFYKVAVKKKQVPYSATNNSLYKQEYLYSNQPITKEQDETPRKAS